MDVIKLSLSASETKKFFYRINQIISFLGMPNFWVENLWSKRFVKYYTIFITFCDILVIILIVSEFAAFYTQTNLTEKQETTLKLYAFAHPTLFGFYLLISYYKERVKKVMNDLITQLKNIYNDLDIERQMIKKLKKNLTALISFCVISVLLYTVDALLAVIKTGTGFNPIILGWPDVDGQSNMANLVRAIFYITWWIFIQRLFAVYILVTSIMTCLSHQYKNLQSYFYGVGEIFEDRLSQEEKEIKYEEALKIGIKMHVGTLRCTEECKLIFRWVISGQIIFNIFLLIAMLAQMLASDRTLLNFFASGFAAFAVLICTGFFMWNAGDVTVEATSLATAIYFSGWHNCVGHSVRMRKLVIITMLNTQRPVVMRGFGIIEWSYQAYLSIVKSSYSVFSVLY